MAQRHTGTRGCGRWVGVGSTCDKRRSGQIVVVVVSCCAGGWALHNRLKQSRHDSRGADSRLLNVARHPASKAHCLTGRRPPTGHVCLQRSAFCPAHLSCMLQEEPCPPYRLSAGCCPADHCRHCCPASEVWQHQRGPWQRGPGPKGRQHQRSRGGAGPRLLVWDLPTCVGAWGDTACIVRWPGVKRLRSPE